MSSHSSHSFRSAAAPLAMLMLMGASSVQAETIDRATLLAEAPERCVAAAQERYGVSEEQLVQGVLAFLQFRRTRITFPVGVPDNWTVQQIR